MPLIKPYESIHNRAIEILTLIVAEWESDPQSVQCFDLNIVREASIVVRILNQKREVEVVR